MKFLAFTLPLLTCRVIYAHSQNVMTYGSEISCPEGYSSASVCTNSATKKDECTCNCRDGLVYHEPHPSRRSHKINDDPCTNGDLTSWTYLTFYRNPNTYEDSKVAWGDVDIKEDGIMVVSDNLNRCEHMEVFVDGMHIGETHGSGKLDNGPCGDVESCLRKNGGQHGYFTIPKGHHTIGLQWTKVTDACKGWSYGYGYYKIYKKC